MRETIAARAFLPWRRSPLKSMYVAWAAGRFAELAGRLGVDHIHAHWATAPTSAAAIMSRITAVPYSFTAHAWDIYAGDSRLREKAAGARFVVTCTRANVRALRQSVPGDYWDKIILNYHGIPIRDVPSHGRQGREDNASRPLRITAVGRLVETKGFSYLLDALREADFPFELTVVGDGPLRRRLEKAAEEVRPKGVVTFKGVVPNERVFEILSQSDCFVMPSVVTANGDRDGIPNVMLEAMSVGLPVVASDISGIPEAVIDSQTGILVEERDARALRGALRRLHDDRGLAARMGERGRRLACDMFDATQNARTLFETFQKHVRARAK